MTNSSPLTPPYVPFGIRRFIKSFASHQVFDSFFFAYCILHLLMTGFRIPSYYAQRHSLFSWFSSILHIHAYNPNYATRLDVCPFAPSTFIDFFATTSRTDFCQTNNTLQCCLFFSHANLTDLPGKVQ